MTRKDFKKVIMLVLSFMIIEILVVLFIVKSDNNNEKLIYKHIINDSIIDYIPTRSDTIEAMANAFAYVESRNTDNAISSCGNYVGCLQISKICVREANKIIKDTVFTYNDRYDKIMSYAIFEILQLEYNPTLDIDKACDVWNKGCSKKYKNAIKLKYFDNLNNL